MFAVTIDQQHSRRTADEVPTLLRSLSAVQTVLPFERTVGDEVQGLLDSADAVLATVEATMRSGDWSVGIGLGEVETPLASSVRATRGEALLRARTAVEAAKKMPPVRIAVRGADDAETVPVARDIPGPAAGIAPVIEAQALLRLVGLVLQRRKEGQWRVIDAVRAAPDRAAAADALGITVQSISKALITSGEDVVRDVYPLLARVLTDADERSTR